MRWLTKLRLRLRSLFRGASVERELDEELGFHIDQQIEEYLAAGMSPSDARAAALRLLGGRAQLEEECRDMRRVAWLEQLVQDLRHASRMLRRSPTFTIVTVMSLALGIGANTAIFSVIEAVLLRPLPYAEPERLVSATLASPQTPRGVVIDPEFAVWRLENRTLASIAAWNDTSFNVTGSGDAERVFAAQVNADFFHVLAVQPVSGRGFSSAEDQRADSRVAILGYDLWQRRFGGDPTCVGRAITLNDSMYSIAGVLPRTLRFPGDFRPELFVPGGYSSPPNWNAQTMGLLHVIGRLRPHVTPEQARTELEEIQRRHANDLPASWGAALRARRAELRSLQGQLVGDLRNPLLLLLGGVTLVLLITCANVAGLQIARTSTRSGELAVRAALGAGRGRLARMLLSESLLLAVPGGALGILAAYWTVPALRSVDALRLPDRSAVDVNPTVLLFAVGLTFVTALLFGLAPALGASRPDLSEAIKGGARPISRGWSSGFRSVLVAGEIALALLTLLGAGLLLKSLATVLSVDFGLRPARMLTLRLRLPQSRYSKPEAIAAFAGELVERTRALAGVESASLMSSIPLTGYGTGLRVLLEGAPVVPPAERPGSALISVAPGYFEALGVPVLAGRTFTAADGPSAPPVAIVNACFARRLFAGRDPVGRGVRWNDQTPWTTVVGVVGDVRHVGLERDPEPELFLPFAQRPTSGLALAARTFIDPAALAAAVRGEIKALDRELPVFDLATMEERLARQTAPRRFELLLIGSFAATALILAALGVYGVVAYTVSQGAREIGLRIALGAEPAQIRRAVVRRGLLLAACGVVPGLAGGYALTRFISSALYGVSPRDGATFGMATAVILGVATLASWLPARRAARIDPVQALRTE